MDLANLGVVVLVFEQLAKGQVKRGTSVVGVVFFIGCVETAPPSLNYAAAAMRRPALKSITRN